jgi:menaquinone-specific isochorismate synthase
MPVSIDKIDQFLLSGAFIQLNPDLYRLFWGPFEATTGPLQNPLKDSSEYIVSCDFWSFLGQKFSFINLYQPQESVDLNQADFIQFCRHSTTYNRIQKTVNWNFQSPAEFKNQFDWVQENIQHHFFAKALPITLQTAEVNFHLNLSYSIEHILKSKDGMTYGLWHDGQGFLGCTPELLAEYFPAKSEVNTVALAGTWLKNNELIDFNDLKTRHEHNVVMQDIQTQLASQKMKYKSETKVIELSKLFHLKTDFTFECHSQVEYIEMLQKLHPTAALGLYPRDTQLMKQFSKFPLQQKRQKFGSPFGVVSSDYCRVIVAIRNVSWNQTQLQLFAGCGVTAQSEYQKEWNEVLSKQNSVKDMLGLSH